MASLGGMRDNAIDDRPVILPQPEQPHAFQRSDFHRFCDLCTRRRGDIVHDYETVVRAVNERQRNIARERAR